MNSDQRKAALAELAANENNVASTGINVVYRGQTVQMKVYRIPQEYLIYNKYNGRISSRVKAFERQDHVLNPELEEDVAIIEGFLWESNEQRNRRTMDDLVRNGQLRHGIVTADGVIIDGNRRASLMNRAWRERDKHNWLPSDVDKCRYFLAVILPDNATPRDIQQLETTYQMGEDDKLDYNPIEKYLKCRDLQDLGFDDDEIAEMMGEKPLKIRNMLNILELMDDYLESLDYEDMYPMLDKSEDLFINLEKALRDWRQKSKLASANWEYTDTDIDDLKLIAFDYIRSGFEGKDFRRICKPGKDGSLFQNRRVWEAFSKRHFDTVDEIKEPTVQEEMEDHEEITDVVQILRARDDRWKAQVEDPFKRNFKHSERWLDDDMDDAKPKEVLIKVKDLLGTIDTKQDGFLTDPDVANLVREINKMTYNLKRTLGQ
jgi:ParB-like chromosome segregation protein Spo0J